MAKYKKTGYTKTNISGGEVPGSPGEKFRTKTIGLVRGILNSGAKEAEERVAKKPVAKKPAPAKIPKKKIQLDKPEWSKSQQDFVKKMKKKDYGL